MAELAQIAKKQSFSRSTAVKLRVIGSRSRQPSLSSVLAASSLPGQSVEWPVPPVPAINVTSGSTDGHAESTGRSKSTSILQVPVSAIPIRTKRNEEPLELLERGDDADSDTASESDVFYDASEQPPSPSRARWTPVCSSVRPLRAHTATLVQKYIYIVGGHDGSSCTADVWQVDTTADFTWKAVVCTAVRNGALPRPMRAHTAVYIPRCDTHDSPPGHLAVFGGGNGSFYSDELWLLDIYSHEWQKVVIDGPKPSPRRAHAAVFHPGSHRMIVFGGGDGSRAMDDTWVLDCTRPGNFTWSEAVSEGRRPPARAYHTLTLLDDKIVLIGGTDGVSVLSDIWVMGTKDLKWSCLSPTSVPKARLAYAAIAFDNQQILVLGGHDGLCYLPASPGSAISIRHGHLQEVRTISCNSQAGPAPRGYHAAVRMSNGQIWLHGGFDGATHFADAFLLTDPSLDFD